MVATQLEVLAVLENKHTAGYQMLSGLKALRCLGVDSESCDEWELVCRCSNLDWLTIGRSLGEIEATTGVTNAAPFIHHLALVRCPAIEFVGPLDLRRLRSLVLDRCDVVSEVDLCGLPRLQELTVASCGGFKAITSDAMLQHLTVAALSHCAGLQQFDLGMCAGLTHLTVHDCDRLVALELPASLSTLQHLSVTDCPRLRAPQVRGCKDIDTLIFIKCDLQLSDDFADLTVVRITKCPTAFRLNLSACVHLVELTILDCTAMEQLSVSPQLATLRSLRIVGCGARYHLPLRYCAQLEKLWLVGCYKTPYIQLPASLPLPDAIRPWPQPGAVQPRPEQVPAAGDALRAGLPECRCRGAPRHRPDQPHSAAAGAVPCAMQPRLPQRRALGEAVCVWLPTRRGPPVPHLAREPRGAAAGEQPGAMQCRPPPLREAG